MKADFELSADSKTLASVLLEAQKDETITYERLSKAIGRDVRADASGALQTARRLAQREQRMVFDAVRGVGLKRLQDSDIVDLSDKARDQMRRTARRTAKKLVCVDFDGLPNDKKVKHNAALSMMGALATLTTETSFGRLQSKVQQTRTDHLPAAKAAIAALGAIA